MENAPLYHFSKKVVGLALVFLGLSAAIIFSGSRFSDLTPSQAVTPLLTFSDIHDVQVKGVFDEGFEYAKSGQTVRTGLSIKTGAQSFAEITLGETKVRLNQNTEMVFQEGLPTLSFELLSGDLMVKAFDPVLIKTPQSHMLFSHSVGQVHYEDGVTRVMAFEGSADVTLFDKPGSMLASYTVPSGERITYVESQLSPTYAILEYSKLKKELKASALDPSDLNQDYVTRYLSVKETVWIPGKPLLSKPIYDLKSAYYNLRSRLAFTPASRESLAQNQLELRLNYLLGGVQQRSDLNEARILVDEISRSGKTPLLMRVFYSLQNVSLNSPAYLLKETLRKRFLETESPVFLRTYFADFSFALKSKDTAGAEQIQQAWRSAWNSFETKENLKELQSQDHLMHAILMTYADRITPVMLTYFDELGQKQIELDAGSNETLFTITRERLDLVRGLMAAYRYDDAKAYLKSSYESLGIESLSTEVAVRQVFFEDAKFLAQRLEYAVSVLHSAATPIDEAAFDQFLSSEKRDELLSKSFEDFLNGSKAPETALERPSLKAVADRFAAARLVLSEEDITPDPLSLYEFRVKNVELLDRTDDGRLISFDARYDYLSSGIDEIRVGELPYKGSYALSDFVSLIRKSRETASLDAVPASTPADETLAYFSGEEDEALRSEVVAQDLAVSLMIKEFVQNGIQIADRLKVEVLDKATLTRFHINEATLTDSTQVQPLQVQFDYDLTTKQITKASTTGLKSIALPDGSLSSFKSSAFDQAYFEERKKAALEEVIRDFRSRNVLLDPSNMGTVGRDVTKITFKNARLTALGIEWGGTYDRDKRVLVEASHALLKRTNVTPDAYLTDLIKTVTADFLRKQGIQVSLSQITPSSAYNEVTVSGVLKGADLYTFGVDFENSRLVNVGLEGSVARITSMTFEEFNNL